MDKLKDKTILIGKEPGNGRLLISVNINGQPKNTVLGELGSVPNSVSRCKPSEGVAHCKIHIGNDGALMITNLKPQNVTYVNDIEIETKKITPSSKVTIGSEKFPLDIKVIVDTAKKLIPALPREAKSIKHLEKVWQEFESNMEEIQIRQLRKSNRRMLPIMLGSASSVLAAILATCSSLSTLYVTIPISFICFSMYFKIYFEKDTTIEDRKKANDQLFDKYVCPHDDCHHYLSTQAYRVIKQNKKCPFCGGEWKE